jgi:hypothetical protein
LLQPLAKGLPGLVQADGEIVRRQAELTRHPRARLIREIDPPKQHGVLGLERRQQAVETDAGDRLQLRVGGCPDRLALALERILQTAPGGSPPVVVHHDVAEHAPEPSLDVGVPVQRRLAPDDLEPDLLQRVLGILAGAQPADQEADEAVVARGKRLAHALIKRPERFIHAGTVFTARLIALFRHRRPPRGPAIRAVGDAQRDRRRAA